VELRSGEQTERHSYHSWTWPLAVDPSESKSDKENEEQRQSDPHVLDRATRGHPGVDSVGVLWTQLSRLKTR